MLRIGARHPLALTTPRDLGAAASTQCRTVIVPMQLKAYGGLLNQAARGTKGLHRHTFLVSPKQLSGPRRTKCVPAFETMNLSLEVCDALSEMQVTTPSPVQQTAITAVLERKDVIIAAPAGTGKTLAALAPIFTSMSIDRDLHKVPLRERRPRCLIFAPTTELVEQIEHVCRKLGEKTGLTTVALKHKARAKHAHKLILNNKMADVIVLSPHLAQRLVHARRLFLDDLRHVILDEADELLSPKFDGYGAKFLNMVERRTLYKHLWPVKTQKVLISATVTATMGRYRNSHIPEATMVAMPNTHETNTRAIHSFYPVPRKVDRLTHLVYLLNKGGNKPLPWPVEAADGDVPKAHTWLALPPGVRPRARSCDFEGGPSQSVSLAVAAGSGNADDAKDVVVSASSERALTATSWTNPAGLPQAQVTKPGLCVWENQTTRSAPFTGAVRRLVLVPGERVMIFFSSIDRATAIYHHLHNLGFKVAIVHGALPTKVRTEMFERWATGQCNIVCTTNVLARGADYLVDRVINFDCPLYVAEYLHRAGRTARMGRVGRVSTLFGKHEKQAVDNLRMFTKGGIALEKISHFTKQVTLPTYAQYRGVKRDAVARNFIKLISTRTVPKSKEKTFLRTRATWRPLFHPKTIHAHAGIAPVAQQKYMDKVTEAAIWRRRELEAVRKGGRAKFGSYKPSAGDGNSKQMVTVQGLRAGSGYDPGLPTPPTY